MSREVEDGRGPGSGIRDPMARDEEVLAEVDRELKAALSVSPSTDFGARVLQRVEEDRAEGRSYSVWLAAAASIVLVTGLFYALNRTSATDPAPPRQVAERGADIVLASPQPTPATNEPQAPRVVAIARATRETAPGPQPEVIVPLNQMEAVRRLVRAVNEGRVVGAIAAPPEGPVAPPAELAVAPLVVEPIPVPALEPGAEAPAPEIRRSY